jgi:transglutaminase-like putative cysteine protease
MLGAMTSSDQPGPDGAAPSDDPAAYLAPGVYVDSDHPDVIAWAERAIGDAQGDRDKAVRLFYAVRDGFRYDPYSFTFDPRDYKASSVVKRRRAFCVPKAVMLVAAARAVGVPARLGFADVKNHLTSPKLRRAMGTDVFAFHGYAELYLEGKWVKATPAFNLELCDHFHVHPLDFDGRSDALFHELSADGKRHMEYIRDRGRFGDLPFDALIRAFEEVYSLAKVQAAGRDEDFPGDED